MPKIATKRDLVRNSVLFARHVLPAAIRPARTLWNEVIGFLFFVFSLGAGTYFIRAVLDHNHDPGNIMRMFLSGIFFVVMFYYGFASFRKARRISRT